MKSLEEEIEVKPLTIKNYPLRKHVVGEAGKFIDEIIENITGSNMYYAMGIKPDKTYLLYGPPGTGKTMSVNAIYNEINKHLYTKIINQLTKNNFNNIKNFNQYKKTFDENIEKDLKMMAYEYSIGKMGTAFINMGSRRVQQFFEKTFLYAQIGMPTLIIIDEADTLFASRKGYDYHSEDKKVLETLMTNIQIAHDTKNIYLALMTNLPEICDEASLRAGRIDKRWKFDLPNIEERKIAFTKMIENTNKQAGYQVIRNYDIEKLSKLSNGFNYADIQSVLDKTIRNRVKEILKHKKKGQIVHGYVKQNRLEDMVIKHKNEFKKENKMAKIGF